MYNTLLQVVQYLTEQTTIADLCLFVLVACSLAWNFVLFRRNRAQPESSQVQSLKEQIEQLQQEQEEKKRKKYGLVARWRTPNEEESTYALRLFNDTEDKIYNISAEAPGEYRDFCEFHIPQDSLEPDQEANLYFLPDRHPFAEKWIENKTEPILLTLKYTKTPLRRNFRTLQVPFKVNHTTQHFRAWLRKLTEKKEI